MKEKIITEQNIARFEKELKKSEKNTKHPSTNMYVMCGNCRRMPTEEVSPET